MNVKCLAFTCSSSALHFLSSRWQNFVDGFDTRIPNVLCFGSSPICISLCIMRLLSCRLDGCGCDCDGLRVKMEPMPRDLRVRMRLLWRGSAAGSSGCTSNTSAHKGGSTSRTGAVRERVVAKPEVLVLRLKGIEGQTRDLDPGIFATLSDALFYLLLQGPHMPVQALVADHQLDLLLDDSAGKLRGEEGVLEGGGLLRGQDVVVAADVVLAEAGLSEVEEQVVGLDMLAANDVSAALLLQAVVEGVELG